MVIWLVACVPTLTPPDLVDNPGDDWDGDGYTENEGDCDDAEAAAHPGGDEACGDGIDGDCDGGSDGCVWTGDRSVSAGFRVQVREQDGEGGYSFGALPDADGDGVNELLVGLPGYDMSPVTDVGAFLVYAGPVTEDVSLRSGTWQLGLDAAGRMGTVVGSAGDFDGDGVADALCTVPDYASGSVAVWNRPLESPAYLYADGNADGDRLGAAAVSVGDQDDDGTDDILAGAPGAGSGAGAAVLVYGTSRGPVASTEWLDGEGGGLGGAVAAPGDLDGDGFGDMVVSAPEGDGVVYVLPGPFDRAAPLTEHRLDGDGDEGLGAALSGAGDADGDGLADVALGAPGRDRGDGAVFVYVRALDGGLDAPWATLEGDGREAAGSSLALADDYDGDGLRDFVVGAPSNDLAAEGAGAVYLFGRLSAGTASLTTATVRFLGEVEGDRAGHAVAGLGDVTGDGFPDLGIGAPHGVYEGIVVGTTYVLPGLGGL